MGLSGNHYSENLVQSLIPYIRYDMACVIAEAVESLRKSLVLVDIRTKVRANGIALRDKKGNFILFQNDSTIRAFVNANDVEKYGVKMTNDGNNFYLIKATDARRLSGDTLYQLVIDAYQNRQYGHRGNIVVAHDVEKQLEKNQIAFSGLSKIVEREEKVFLRDDIINALPTQSETVVSLGPHSAVHNGPKELCRDFQHGPKVSSGIDSLQNEQHILNLSQEELEQKTREVLGWMMLKDNIDMHELRSAILPIGRMPSEFLDEINDAALAQFGELALEEVNEGIRVNKSVLKGVILSQK